MKTIGEIMNQRREAAVLSQHEVARRGGPRQPYQSLLESDRRNRGISVGMLLRWCSAIGCDPVEVFAEIVTERSGE